MTQGLIIIVFNVRIFMRTGLICSVYLYHSFSNAPQLAFVYDILLLLFSRSVESYSLLIPCTIAPEAPLSMGFPRTTFRNDLQMLNTMVISKSFSYLSLLHHLTQLITCAF